MKNAFGEYFLRMVVEAFHKLYIKGGNGPEGDKKNNVMNLEMYMNLRKKTEYGLAVRFAILVRPQKDNFYSAINMWHSVDGYIRLTSLNDRLFVTPDIVRVVGKSVF